MILFRNPNGTAPIFALTSRMGKKTVTDPEFSWWDEPNDLVRVQMSAGVNAAAVALTIDSGDPDASNPDRHWGSGLNLVEGDLLMVEPSADSAAFTPEIVAVSGTPTATNIPVARGQAGTNAAAIADNAYLLKIGSAFREGTRSPEAASRNPIKYKNYTQIFKNTYEITGTAEQTETRTGDPVKNDKKRKSFDHSRDIELAILFGQRHEVTTGGKPIRYTGGLREFIPAKILDANWSMSNLLDDVASVFNWDTMAGDTRLVFCGNGALNAFNKKIFTDDNTGDINYSGKESMYGMRFNRYTIPQGDFLLKTHPLMSRHPVYTNSWFIIDGSMLKWCPMRGRDTKFKDNVQYNDEDTRRGYWQTEGGIMVDGGGLTMKYVGGFNL